MYELLGTNRVKINPQKAEAALASNPKSRWNSIDKFYLDLLLIIISNLFYFQIQDIWGGIRVRGGDDLRTSVVVALHNVFARSRCFSKMSRSWSKCWSVSASLKVATSTSGWMLDQRRKLRNRARLLLTSLYRIVSGRTPFEYARKPQLP